MILQFLKKLVSNNSATSAVKLENKSFVDVLTEYIDRYMKENQVCEGTEIRYKTQYNNTMYFLNSAGLINITMDQLRAKHAEQFRGWLRCHLKTCSIRYASRHVELWKRASRYAVEMEYTQVDYLNTVKSQRDKEKPLITLTIEEVLCIKEHRFTGMLQLAADRILFQCFTGLSDCDIDNFEIIGDNRFKGNRQKSGNEFYGLFFDEAKEIYNKYNGSMPKISNQKYNMYLKEIAYICGINKRLTSHVGRKTFATLLAERGMSGKGISIWLGNTERVANKDYINTTFRILENEIRRVGIGNSLLIGIN